MSGVTVVARYREEALDKALQEEIFPLLHKHWKEVAHHADIQLQIDWDAYYAMQERGILRVYTAREQNGKLVGYAVFVIRHNPHYKSSLNALQDVLFIDPAKRGFGMKFIAWCDEQLKKEDVQLVIHHVKSAHNFGPMLERIGYELIDLIYGRRLDLQEAEEDVAGKMRAQEMTGRTV